MLGVSVLIAELLRWLHDDTTLLVRISMIALSHTSLAPCTSCGQVYIGYNMHVTDSNINEYTVSTCRQAAIRAYKGMGAWCCCETRERRSWCIENGDRVCELTGKTSQSAASWCVILCSAW